MKRVWKNCLILLSVFVMLGVCGIAVNASDISSYAVEVTYGQTEARSMFAMINDFRTGDEAWYWSQDGEKITCTGLSELEYDYQLEAIAMLRAKEIAVSYSHMRPKYTSDDEDPYVWSLVSENGGFSYVGENIAAGQTTAENAFISWREDDEEYSGQGHRRNMLSEGFTAVGIGHVYYNGYHYWVQIFRAPTGTGAVTDANDETVVETVEIHEENITDKVITPSAASVTLSYGKTIDLPSVKTYIYVKNGWPTTKRPVTAECEWSVADESIAEIADGQIKGKSAGTTTLTISALDTTTDITVTVKPVSVENAEVVLETDSYTYDGNAKEPAVTSLTAEGITLTEGTDFTAVYSDNTDAGTAKVTITGMNNCTGTVEKEFTIEKADLDTECSVSEIAALTYTGDALEPALTVTRNQSVLTENTDYTVRYSNNTNAGTASAVLTGINNYTGTITVTFEIEPIVLTADMVGAIAEQKYSGSAVTPALTVKSGDTVLADGTDYTVEYSSNTNAGTADVTVTGKGNYAGTVETSFVITKADLADVTFEAIEQQVYAAAEITPALSAKYNDHTLTKDTDYSVTYENNTNTGTAKVTVTGKGNYTGTYETEFVIAPADLGANCTTAQIEAVTYTGAAWTPEVIVTGTLETLVKDTDYTVSYADNINAGTASVTLTGIKNYSGTITKTFEIEPVVLTADMVETIDAVTYSGEAIIPEITVKTETATLANGTDYNVTYSNNTNVGTASAAVTGKGNYTGEVGVLFDITKADINDAVFAEIQNQKYTGNAVTPEISAKYNNYILIKDKDYSVTYEENTDVGTAKVTIVGIGNFNGTVETTFVIEKADISAATVVIADQTYCAAAIEPAAEVSFEGEVLTAADYDIAYQDNTTVGTAKVTVTGKGKYIGSLETTFVIVPADLKANCTVTEIEDQTYTGSMLTPAVTVSGKLESLVNGIDYTIAYVNNQNAGTATVILTGKGNYTGTADVSFKIVEKEAAGGSTSGDAGSTGGGSTSGDTGSTGGGSTSDDTGSTDGSTSDDAGSTDGSTSGGTDDSGTTVLPVGTEIKNTAANAYFTVTGQSEDGITEVQYTGPVSTAKTKAVVPATVTSNGVACSVTSVAANAFRNNKKLKSVTIGKNVTSIGNNAFYGCTKLSNVTIGSSVKTIGTKAFYKCTALKKITIPSKVTKIGKQAFYGCKNLKTITIKTAKLSKKTVGSKAFTGIYKKATIKVPKSKLKAYKSMLKARGVSSKAKIRK